MIINKIMETYVDIINPNDIYSIDINNMVIEKLNEKFVGICYKSCYILKIIRIIKRSCIYMKDTLEGDAHVSVMFEVSAIQYVKNEIINGCKIIKKESNGIVHAKSEYAGIQFNIPSNMNIFKEGDIIPVIVNMVRYNVNQNAISILAHPFMPQNKEPIYYKINNKITTTLTSEETLNIKSLLDQLGIIEEQVSKLNDIDKKVYKFFVDLLTLSNIKKTNKRKSIYDITDIKNNTIYFSDIYDSNNVNILDNDDNKNLENKEIFVERAFIIYSNIIIDYIMRLQTLIEFIKYFPTCAKIQEHKHIWKLYLSLKN